VAVAVGMPVPVVMVVMMVCAGHTPLTSAFTSGRKTL
jgi:hypothetical protein